MKKQIALISLLLFTCNVIFSQHDSIAPTSDVRNDHPISLHQEGFAADTLVKTPNGYVPIQLLQVNNIVISNDQNNNLQQSFITGITKYYTTYCIKIVIDDCICHVAPQQKFYISSKKEWLAAEHIKPGDMLYTCNGNRCVIDVECIERSLLMYAITVDHHSLYITPSDILVHNMDPILGGVATFTAVVAPNPVGAIVVPALVITAATGIFIYRLCKLFEQPKPTHIDQFNDAAASSEQLCPAIIYHAPVSEQQLHTHEIDSQKPKNQPPQNVEPDEPISDGGSELPPEDPEDDPNKPNEQESIDPHNNKPGGIKISEDNSKHIFADRPGHLTDTPENRDLLLKLVSDIKNYFGPNKHGSSCYAKTLENGKQLWAYVWNGEIRNGGINDIPKVYNPISGFNRLIEITK